MHYITLTVLQLLFFPFLEGSFSAVCHFQHCAVKYLKLLHNRKGPFPHKTCKGARRQARPFTLRGIYFFLLPVPESWHLAHVIFVRANVSVSLLSMKKHTWEGKLVATLVFTPSILIGPTSVILLCRAPVQNMFQEKKKITCK